MKLSLKLECLLLFCLAALTGWADAIQGSTTDPASGRPSTVTSLLTVRATM